MTKREASTITFRRSACQALTAYNRWIWFQATFVTYPDRSEPERVISPIPDIRLPLIVISPFAKKNYVSHTVRDYTAILNLVESRFNLPALTNRDAAQADMSEFFDFVNVPWATPPSPPPRTHRGRVL